MRNLMVWMACAAGLITTQALAAAASRPAQPATQGANVKTKITPEAQKILDDMQKAYDGLKSLRLRATVVGESVMAWGTIRDEGAFDALYLSPNLLKVTRGATVIRTIPSNPASPEAPPTTRPGGVKGSTGDLVYEQDEYTKTDTSTKAPAGRFHFGNPSGDPLKSIRFSPLSSLAAVPNGVRFALFDDGLASLMASANEVKTGDAVVVNGLPCDTLILTVGARTTRLHVDQKKHLLRQETLTVPNQRGQAVIDYVEVAPDVSVDKDVFRRDK